MEERDLWNLYIFCHVHYHSIQVLSSILHLCGSVMTSALVCNIIPFKTLPKSLGKRHGSAYFYNPMSKVLNKTL